MVKKELGILILIFVINISYVNALDFNHVITNSDNWRDVYSAIHFANLNGAGNDFLVSTRHGNVLMTGLSKENKYLVISSNKRAFVLNYPDSLNAKDFETDKELKLDNFNLELIEELPNINNFVIIGNTYGYSAIAVAPYAKVSNSWVFFADRTNIDEIDNILQERNPKNVLIYGFVDNEVKDSLERYSPEYIDTGDRFKDNIEIVKKYLKINPTKQAVLSNGEFIEKELMSGVEPVLFTGKENVPDQISDYLKNSDFEVGVLVGSDLVGAATNIRRSTGVSVIVKFARGARSPAGAVANVEGLDLFYLPIPDMRLSIYNARYNRASNQLEITYKSDSNIPVFLKGTITYTDSNGERLRVGDTQAIFIAPNDYKTIAYPNLNLNGNNITIDIFTLYGDTPTSLEKILEKTLTVDIVDVIDKCDVELKSLKYNKQKSEFITGIKNKGSVDCWVDIELIDVVIDGEETTLGLDGAVKINSGDTKKIPIKYELSEDDISNNEIIEIFVYYGEKQDSLTKLIKGKLKLDVEFISIYLIILIIMILLLILVIIFLFIKKRKQEEEI